MPCNLDYIPKHLHRVGRSELNDFENEENIFFRIHPKHRAPFENISLADLSFNRDGGSLKISEESDVLWNTNPDKDIEKYDWETLSIKIIHYDNSEIVESPSLKIRFNSNFVCLKLSHNPLECNYAHCDLNFLINGEILVTKENYEETFKHKKFKKLRQSTRFHLHSAVIKNKLNFGTETLYPLNQV